MQRQRVSIPDPYHAAFCALLPCPFPPFPSSSSVRPRLLLLPPRSLSQHSQPTTCSNKTPLTLVATALPIFPIFFALFLSLTLPPQYRLWPAYPPSQPPKHPSADHHHLHVPILHFSASHRIHLSSSSIHPSTRLSIPRPV